MTAPFDEAGRDAARGSGPLPGREPARDGGHVPGEEPVADGAAEPDREPPAGQPSGLRNPGAAVRGVAAGALVLEAIVLLLAIQPIRVVGHLSGIGVWAMVVLAALCVVLAGLMRRRWAWHAGTALQVLVIAGGVFQWGVAVIGLVFGGLWLYVLHIRRTVLGGRSG